MVDGGRPCLGTISVQRGRPSPKTAELRTFRLIAPEPYRLDSVKSPIKANRKSKLAPYCTKCTVWGVVSLTRPIAEKYSYPKRVFDPT